DCEPGDLLQIVQRQILAVGREATGGPKRHSSHRAKAVAIAAAAARIIGADRWARGKLRLSLAQPPRLPDSRIRRRVKERAPDLTQRAIGLTLATAPDQSVLRRSSERCSIAGLKRGRQTRYQGIEVGDLRLRCCHVTAPVRNVSPSSTTCRFRIGRPRSLRSGASYAGQIALQCPALTRFLPLGPRPVTGPNSYSEGLTGCGVDGASASFRLRIALAWRRRAAADHRLTSSRGMSWWW